jgi:hypothetical protein
MNIYELSAAMRPFIKAAIMFGLGYSGMAFWITWNAAKKRHRRKPNG